MPPRAAARAPPSVLTAALRTGPTSGRRAETPPARPSDPTSRRTSMRTWRPPSARTVPRHACPRAGASGRRCRRCGTRRLKPAPLAKVRSGKDAGAARLQHDTIFVRCCAGAGRADSGGSAVRFKFSRYLLRAVRRPCPIPPVGAWAPRYLDAHGHSLATGGTRAVQNAHRVASATMSLRHSGPSRIPVSVVSSEASGRKKSTNASAAITTKATA